MAKIVPFETVRPGDVDRWLADAESYLEPGKVRYGAEGSLARIVWHLCKALKESWKENRRLKRRIRELRAMEGEPSL